MRKKSDEDEEKPSQIQRLKELWTIMENDLAISYRLPELRSLARRAFGWMIVVELFFVLRMVPLAFFVNELNRPEPKQEVLVSITLGTTALYIIVNSLGQRMCILRDILDLSQWSVWHSYGKRCELRQSLDYLCLNNIGKRESTVGKSVDKFQGMIDQIIFQTTPILLRVTFVSIGMWFVSPLYGLVAFVTIGCYALSLRKTEKQLHEQQEKHREELKAVESYGTELSAGWQTIKEIGREAELCDEYNRRLAKFCTNEEERSRQRWLRYTRQGTVLAISRGGLYGAVSLSTLWQQPNVGAVVLAFGWLEHVYSNLWRLVDFQVYVNQGMGALNDLVGLMKTEPTVKQPDNPVSCEGLASRFVIKDLGFSYPSCSDRRVLMGINVTMKPGTSTALVGESGSGKSTFAALLQRQYDPCEGVVSVDGHDLKDLDLFEYRKSFMSVVSQRVHLFDNTIADNIRMAHPSATDAEVVEAAKQAHIHDFIMRQPGGYRAMVGENGVRISGGEQQRLAIARALVRRPKLLILDEATSALDGLLQDNVRESIDALIATRTCTVLIIAHRLSTLRNVDQVVVMKHGTIIDIGTHEELYRRCSYYRELRDMESRGLLN